MKASARARVEAVPVPVPPAERYSGMATCWDCDRLGPGRTRERVRQHVVETGHEVLFTPPAASTLYRLKASSSGDPRGD